MISRSEKRNWQPLVRIFETIVGREGVVWTPEELLVFECDGLTSYRQKPAVAVLPRTTGELAAVLRTCHREGVSFVARGSGTGLSGGALPTEDCVLVVTTRMNRILKIDLDNQRIVVQPGVVNNWVTQAVAGAGFYYAPDPSSQLICSVGGNVAENSGGVHCLKYGVTTNHVLGLKVVLPDGEIADFGGMVAEMPGYDLTGLFVGSEGTLGIAAEVTLRILKTAECVRVLLADFATIEAAGAAVTAIIAAGIVPGGMEIMDNLSINAVEDVVATECYPRDAGAILLIEVDGRTTEAERDTGSVVALCREAGARDVRVARDLQERLKLWKGRKAAFAAMGRRAPNYYVQDGVIPRTKLQYVLQQIENLSAEHGYPVANVFHAGDGNLHPLILYNGNIPGELEKVEALGGEILKLCVRVGGSITGEHGVGAEKRCYMDQMFSPADLETQIWVRTVFDPRGLANPDKLFPTPRTCGEAARAQVHGSFRAVEVY